MEWIIDRIEENIAVVEICNGRVIEIPISALPSGVSENDVITVEISNNKTEERKEKINRLADSLFAD